MNGRILIFRQPQKTGKVLNETIRQLLLISYFYRTILNKQGLRTNQNIIISESLLEKIHLCQNNSEKSYTKKKVKHTPSGYSWFSCCSYDASKNELGYYREKNCMEKFCKDLRERSENNQLYKKRSDTTNR